MEPGNEIRLSLSTTILPRKDRLYGDTTGRKRDLTVVLRLSLSQNVSRRVTSVKCPSIISQLLHNLDHCSSFYSCEDIPSTLVSKYRNTHTTHTLQLLLLLKNKCQKPICRTFSARAGQSDRCVWANGNSLASFLLIQNYVDLQGI